MKFEHTTLDDFQFIFRFELFVVFQKLAGKAVCFEDRWLLWFLSKCQLECLNSMVATLVSKIILGKMTIPVQDRGVGFPEE